VGWFRRTEDRDLKPIELPTYAGEAPVITDPVLEATPYNALRISDAYACIRVLADTVSTLPVRAYRDTGQGRVQVGPDARISRLLGRPSPGSTSADLFSRVMVDLNTHGNCFLGKWRGADGEIVSLSALPADQVNVIMRGQTISYQIWLPNQDTVEFGLGDICHIKGMSSDGLVGLSPVTCARLALTLSSNLQEASRQYFLNGSRPSGILSVSGPQDDFTIQAVKERWDARQAGTTNLHRIAVLSGQATFTPVSFSADDSQFLGQRELSAREVARIFRVPSHLIDAEPSHGSSRTYANVNQQNLSFLQHSLRPWLVRIERAFAADADLCPGGTYIEFSTDGLLRGDPDLRSTIYQRALGSTSTGQPGWLTVDEVRELENLEPMAVEQAETPATEAAEGDSGGEE
jgi:HK97 family phage portal protein